MKRRSSRYHHVHIIIPHIHLVIHLVIHIPVHLVHLIHGRCTVTATSSPTSRAATLIAPQHRCTDSGSTTPSTLARRIAHSQPPPNRRSS